MIATFTFIQSTRADTASAMQNYADKWEANTQAEQAGVIMQALASNDLIYVVLAVSLIIWFVLLFYIIRTDRKVSRLEESLTQQADNKENET